MSFAEKLYRLLLRAYPARLREEHGPEMLQLFGDQLRDARARGHVARLWLRTSADWLRTMLVEHLTQPSGHISEPRAATPTHTLVMRGLLLSPNPAAAVLIVAGIVAYRRVREPGFFHQKPHP